MLRNTLIFLLVLLAWASPAYASHGFEPALPSGAAPADRAVFPTVSSADSLPALRVGPAGDVNGDGTGDVVTAMMPGWGSSAPEFAYVLFTPPAGADYPEPVLSRPGFRIRGLHGESEVGSAGDVNGDGLGDVAVAASGVVSIVFGKTDHEPVDLRALGDAGFSIHGITNYWWYGGIGLFRNSPVVDVGDQNGDGLSDLVIAGSGAVHLIHTPSPPAGAVVDVASSRGVRTFSAPTWSTLEVASAGDMDGDGLVDVIAGWRNHDAARAKVAGFGLGGAGSVQLDELAERGDGWELDAGDTYIQGVGSVREQGTARRAYVATNGSGRLLLALPPFGAEQALDDVPYERAPGFDFLVDVGDQDADGLHDLGGAGEIVYRGLTDDQFSGVHFPYDGFQTLMTSSVGDVDRDGFDDVALARVRHSYRDAEGQDNVGEWAIEIHHSRSWPHDHDPSRMGWTPSEGPPPYETWCCDRGPYPGYGPDGYWGPRPSPATPPPSSRAEARRRALEAVSETPAYVGGNVEMTLRTTRGSTVTAEATGTGWRPGGPVWGLGTSEAPSRSDPWVRLRFALPPDARRAIEADGRLRLSIATKVRSSSGRVTTPPALAVVAVTRPRPGAFGSQRRLRGSFGVQRLLGGPLADLITGASADDVLRGGAGNDALHGGTGNDTLFGDLGGDLVDGDDGDDRSFGGPGNDQLVELRFGDDTLSGDDGDDFVSGGRGEDSVSGGPGDDVLAGGSGPDQVSCGLGEDIVFVNFSAERSRVTGCEHVYDEPGVIHVPCADGGTDGPETVLGTEGDDRCVGGGGGDDLEGRGGDDVLLGGAGNDRAFGRFGRDLLDGGDGDDELEGGRGADVLRGGAGNDQLNGGYDSDVVSGGPGDDRITARGGGADRVDCGPGIDRVFADSGDRLVGCERVHRSGR